MSIIESIKKARESGQSDEQILSEIIRQNEEKAPAFEKAKERGATATEIINEIIEQNSPKEPSANVFTKEKQEKENEEREQFLRKMDSRDKGEPLEEEIPPPPEPKPIPGEEDPYAEEISKEDLDFSMEEPEKSEGVSEEDFSFQQKEEPLSKEFNDVPEKPKEEDKVWVRVIIVLALVVLLAIVSAFFYWALILKPPVVEKEVVKPVLIEKEVSVPHTPKPLIKINPAVDNVSRFVVTTPEEYIITMGNITKKKLNSELTHIVIEDHRDETPRISDLEDFFSLFEIEYPSSFFDLLEKDFTLVVYPEGKENRFGFVGKTKEGEDREEGKKNREDFQWLVMRPWERSIEKDFQQFFSLIDVELSENNNDLLEKDHDKYKIRYREVPKRENDRVEVTRFPSAKIYPQPNKEEELITSATKESTYVVVGEENNFYKILLIEDTNNDEDPTENEEVIEEDPTENEEVIEEDPTENEEEENIYGWIEKSDVKLLRSYKEDVGIYYTIIEDRFIFAMSFNGIKKLIDRI